MKNTSQVIIETILSDRKKHGYKNLHVCSARGAIYPISELMTDGFVTIDGAIFPFIVIAPIIPMRAEDVHKILERESGIILPPTNIIQHMGAEGIH